MITIEEKTYRQTAGKLLAAIGAEDYFNGTIELDPGPFNGQFRATLIIYRNGQGDLCDVIPVWWEFIMAGLTGEVDSDFSWSELKNYLL